MIDLDSNLPGICAGDPHAYARWVAGAEPRLRGSLARFAEHVDAEAVLQECLLRVWQVAPRVRPDGRPDALVRFAIRVARNLAISELRRRRVRPSVLAELTEAPPPALSEQPQPPDPLLRRVIAVCREKLPPKPALALGARLGLGVRSDVELAAQLGMKLNTFLQNVTRAKKLLAECLGRHGVDLEAVL
jgi:RNA polymerase sigma-70 factor (ECF subfamily)